MSKEIKFALKAFGFLLGIASCVSLLQRIFEIGLAPVLHALIDYYRALVKPIFTPLNQFIGHYIGFYDILPFDERPIKKYERVDIQLVGLICSGVILRALYNYLDTVLADKVLLKKIIAISALILFALVSITNISVGMLAVISGLMAVTVIAKIHRIIHKYEVENRDGMSAVNHELGVSGWVAVAGIFLFYLINFLMQTFYQPIAVS